MLAAIATPVGCGAFKLSSFGQLVGPSRFSAGPLQEVMRQPGAHVLAQGVPPMASLPIVGVKITLADGTVIELDKAESPRNCSIRLKARMKVSCVHS